MLVTIDFETFYSREYSLSKLSTTRYIKDERFDPILLSVKEGNAPTYWVPKPQIEECLRDLQLEKKVVRAHNARFDAAILSFRYGIRPAFLMCTQSQAVSLGLNIIAKGSSLDALLKAFRAAGHDVPLKGDEVHNVVGMRYEDFDPERLRRYADYGITDVDGCALIGDYMMEMLSNEELRWQDTVLRMFTEPKLRLDRGILVKDLARVQAERKQALKEISGMLVKRYQEAGDHDTARRIQAGGIIEVQRELRSAERFADLLRALGGRTEEEIRESGREGVKFVIPTKVSMTTGKTTYAFAKTDEGMVALADHEDPMVSALVQTKLNVSSSIQLTRLQSLIELAQYERFPLPYNVSGAHTHRLSGADGINVQNMPSGRVPGQSTAMRDSIQAPDGYVIVTADSSQIEPRIGAFIANETGMIEVFAKGQDPYSYMASHIFGGTPEEIAAGAKAGVEPYKSLWRPLGKESVLGLGYGMGRVKFRDNVYTSTRIELTEEEASRIVSIYRDTNSRIRGMWYNLETILREMIAGGSGYFGGPNGDLLYYDGSRQLLGEIVPGIRLPDGMWLNYYRLCEQDEPATPEDGLRKKLGQPYEVRPQFVFYRQRGRSLFKETTYGAKVFENIVQATAFALMKFQAGIIRQRYQPSGNSHDEFFTVVPEDEVEQATAWIEQAMRTVPEVLAGLVVNCEVNVHKQYGKT